MAVGLPVAGAKLSGCVGRGMAALSLSLSLPDGWMDGGECGKRWPFLQLEPQTRKRERRRDSRRRMHNKSEWRSERRLRLGRLELLSAGNRAAALGRGARHRIA